MKAILYERNGPAREVLQFKNMANPVPGPGEVLVDLKASGVNPSDVKGRQGGRSTISVPQIIPHSDGAGIVRAVGTGVAEAVIGKRVWVHNAQWERPFGTAAEQIALPRSCIAILPADMSFEEGACLGIPAMTAHRAVFSDGPVAGQWLLVTGGAGSVGHFAIQFAKWAGARVITTVSSATKERHACAAGADIVLNYRDTDVAAAVLDLTGGAGVDRVIDVEFGGNLATTQTIIRQGGIIATYASSAERYPPLPFYELMYKNVTVRTILVYTMAQTAKDAAIEDIHAAWRDGALKPAVGPTFGLADGALAHEAVEQGTIGNVIVTI